MLPERPIKVSFLSQENGKTFPRLNPVTRGVANNTNLLIADKKKLGDKIKLDKKKTSSGYHKNCICKKKGNKHNSSQA